MMYHKFDADSKIYIESVESEEQPENSVSGVLPDITEHYTIAFINNEWFSVLRPELQIIDDKIVKIEQAITEEIEEVIIEN